MIDSPNYHISIDYQDNSVDDPRLNVYEGVEVLMPGGEVVRFETNDPVEDYKAAIRLTQLMQTAKPGVVFLSSCVDHFVHDVAGYIWDKDDFIKANPKDPPILVPESERVDYDSLTRDQQIAIANMLVPLRSARQVTYVQAKAYPALRSAFLAADRLYREQCARFDMMVDPIFDDDHYRRERAAMGAALEVSTFGRKGRAA